MGRKNEPSNILLVEGNDDKHVILNLCQKHSIHENFDIIDCEGIENLIKGIPQRIKQSGVQVIGVVVDANGSILSRWQSLSTVLVKEGYEVNISLQEKGTIILQSDKPTIGIWIMPNNQTHGTLEDFIACLVPPDDSLIEDAKKVTLEIEKKNLNKYSINHHSKALIHTWLAWQKEPGKPMGQAITNRYLMTDQPICNRFMQWLNSLFKISQPR